MLALSVAAAAGRAAERPPWLRDAIERTVARQFLGAAPTRIDVLGYPRKVAVVFTFARPTLNASVSNPFGNPSPRFRVWRTCFYRPGYHTSTDAWRGCATRRACLYQ